MIYLLENVVELERNLDARTLNNEYEFIAAMQSVEW
jgi:hypothetical protein